ncbi:hypothetical protein JB92DRAFT_3064470 [Gautieria morchelliformis]|nr:hypothetical protein JB92DRAFT_3064470 [Gautieria morchelliformis]
MSTTSLPLCLLIVQELRETVPQLTCDYLTLFLALMFVPIRLLGEIHGTGLFFYSPTQLFHLPGRAVSVTPGKIVRGTCRTSDTFYSGSSPTNRSVSIRISFAHCTPLAAFVAH